MNGHLTNVIAAGTVGLAAAAPGQMRGGWAFEVEYMPGSGGVVSPAFPEARVTLLAWFENAYAFAGGNLDIAADDGSWHDFTLLKVGDPPRDPPPGTPPRIVGSRIEEIFLGQVMLPPQHMPSTANPIPLWEGAWSTGDFTPRSVPVWTENHVRFSGYGPHAPPVPPWLIEPGAATSAVVPAPGAGVAFGVLGLLLLRRRRAAGERKVSG